ncbi:MAG: MFS transporter [Phycisphaeraceae bacterium]|nr:MFS transporter [Phycisphaeraceae bacterium]
MTTPAPGSDPAPTPNGSAPGSAGGYSPEIPHESPDDSLAPRTRLASSVGRMFDLSGPLTLPLRGLASAAVSLRHRNYRLFWAGSFVSNIGSWMHTTARSWLVYELSGHSKLWVGLDAFALGAPALLTPMSGVLADRLDRRWLLGVANLLASVIALALALLYWSGNIQVWQIILSSLFMGLINVAIFPANQSLIPELVGRHELTNAVALNSLQFNSSRVIGPALGGMVLLTLGAGWNFTFNAVSFLAVVAALAVMNLTPAPSPSTHEPPLRSLRQGMSYIRRRPDILVMLALVMLTGVLGSPTLTLLPALSREVFAGAEKEYSYFLSAFGAGAVVGAILLAARSRRGPTPWRIYLTLPCLGAVEALLSVAGRLPVALLLIAAAGSMWVGTMARVNTAILSSTPRHLRGRVSGFFVMCFLVGLPLGSLGFGALADRIGTQPVFVLCGLLLALGSTVIYFFARRAGVRYQAHAADESLPASSPLVPDEPA